MALRKKCFFLLFRGISNEEKMHLRQKLLMHLREENDQVFFSFNCIISLRWCLLVFDLIYCNFTGYACVLVISCRYLLLLFPFVFQNADSSNVGGANLQNCSHWLSQRMVHFDVYFFGAQEYLLCLQHCNWNFNPSLLVLPLPFVRFGSLFSWMNYYHVHMLGLMGSGLLCKSCTKK